jgi:hypothetical protein
MPGAKARRTTCGQEIMDRSAWIAWGLGLALGAFWLYLAGNQPHTKVPVMDFHTSVWKEK